MKRLERSGKDYALHWIAGKRAGLCVPHVRPWAVVVDRKVSCLTLFVFFFEVLSNRPCSVFVTQSIKVVKATQAGSIYATFWLSRFFTQY